MIINVLQLLVLNYNYSMQTNDYLNKGAHMQTLQFSV